MASQVIPHGLVVGHGWDLHQVILKRIRDVAFVRFALTARAASYEHQSVVFGGRFREHSFDVLTTLIIDSVRVKYGENLSGTVIECPPAKVCINREQKLFLNKI